MVSFYSSRNFSRRWLFRAHSLYHPQVNEGAFVIYLMNITTEKRIWKSPVKKTNLNMVEEVLNIDDNMAKEDCKICVTNCEAIYQKVVDGLTNLSMRQSRHPFLKQTACTSLWWT